MEGERQYIYIIPNFFYKINFLQNYSKMQYIYYIDYSHKILYQFKISYYLINKF